MKQRRTTKALDVLELVQGDGHTCDLWVEVTDENGKKRAIRPTLVCWIDTRSRVPLGYVMCEHANSRIIKQSLIKLAYGTPGGVPKGLLIDNGKDFTAKALTGQARSVRTRQEINRVLDAELNGFLTQLGIQKYTRALPYHAWIKGQMERFFGTMIAQFEKRFPSYTGTLTGSRTAAKIEKNIERMLTRGELPTLEAFQQKFEDWLQTVYLVAEHRGLKEQREEWVTPLEVFNHAPHYAKAVPPKDYAQVLCMETGQATVRKDGITKFGTVYVATELCRHVGRRVNIRYERDDLAELHIYDPATAEKICVAVSHELMGMADRVSLDDLEALMRRRNAHKRDVRGRAAELREAYAFKCEREDATPEVVGALELGKQPAPKVASLPEDAEYRRESIRNARGAGRRSGRTMHPAAVMQEAEGTWNRMLGNTAEG
jgi:transposase InsO family protein